MTPVTESVTTCWACAEELPRGAQRCPSCGEPQPTCWACAEPLPRRAARCPSCGESPCAPSSGPGAPSLGYLFAAPFLFAVLGHQLGVGFVFGGLVGLGGWALAAVVSRRSS